jgi:hypothetical protein
MRTLTVHIGGSITESPRVWTLQRTGAPDAAAANERGGALVDNAAKCRFLDPRAAGIAVQGSGRMECTAHQLAGG